MNKFRTPQSYLFIVSIQWEYQCDMIIKPILIANPPRRPSLVNYKRKKNCNRRKWSKFGKTSNVTEKVISGLHIASK